MAKDKNVLEDHPEVTNNARSYFTYETTPVIEKSVNRGDVRQVGAKAYDITTDDIIDLAKFAVSEYLDKGMLEDNRKAAVDSAVAMSIGSYDNGKWQSKINSSTEDIIIAEANKMIDDKVEKRVMAQDPHLNENNTNGQTVEKSAASKGVVVKLKSGRPLKQSPGQVSKALNKMPTRDRAGVRKLIQKGDTVVLSTIIDRLDKVASNVQDMGHVKMAQALDTVANTLEKGGR